ncbi:MAG: hypothetical protein KGM42_02385 [Hyphomicrobiales bacterium]|nr:hypothetical protein [Hyphomicrobiales bacterium]
MMAGIRARPAVVRPPSKRAASSPLRRPKPGAAAKGRGDLVLTMCGIALAGASALLAGVQIANNDGTPKINGGAHLALFGRPSRAVSSEPAAAPVSRDAPAASGSVQPAQANKPAVDYGATASIPRSSAASYGEWIMIGPPELRFVDRGVGAFATTAGVVQRGIGEEAPRGGVIVGFRRRAGNWFALVSRGQTSR